MNAVDDYEKMDTHDLNSNSNASEQEEGLQNEKKLPENHENADLAEDESMSDGISNRFPPPKTYSRVRANIATPDPATMPDSPQKEDGNSDKDDLQEDDPEDDLKKSSTKKKRPARIIDSDSDADPENEENVPSDDDAGLVANKDLDTDDAEPEPTFKKLNRSRIAKMAESDTDSDEETTAANQFDAEPSFRESKENTNTQAEPVFKMLQRSKIVDSDSDSEDNIEHNSLKLSDDSDKNEKSKIKQKRQQKTKSFGNGPEVEANTESPFALLKKGLKEQKPPRQRKPKTTKKGKKSVGLEPEDNSDGSKSDSKNKKSVIPKLFDSDSEPGSNEDQAEGTQEYKKSFASNLIDSDSEEESSPAVKKGKAQPKKRQPKPKEVKEKVPKQPRQATKGQSKRASIQSSRYVNQESESESDEGLIEAKHKTREMEITVDFEHHRPRQCTLKEFLTRKTITLPTIRTDCRRQFKNPGKLTREELEELARKMEEKAKEAAEFFTIKKEKKEKPSIQNDQVVHKNTENNASSEQTTEPFQKDVSPNVKEDQTEILSGLENEDFPNAETSKTETQTHNVEEQTESLIKTQTEDEAISEANKENDDPNAAMIAFLTGTDETVEPPISSESLIPTLAKPCDIVIQENIPLTTEEVAALLAGENILNIPNTPAESEDIFASCETEGTENIPLSEVIKKELPAPVLSMTPTLKGDPDMIIDLESNEIVPKQKTDKEKFFENFINHSKNMKNKGRASVLSILSQSDDPDKVGTPIVILSDEEEIDNSIKKNASIYLKVKEKLKNRVSLKRREGAIKEYEERHKAMEKLKKLEDDEEDEELEEEFDEEMKMEVDEEEEATKATEEVEEENGTHEGEDDAVENIDEEGHEGDDEDDEENEADEDDVELSEEEETEENKNGKRTFKRLQLLEDSEDEDAVQTKFDDVDKNISLNFLNSSVTSEQNVDENELMGLCSGKFDATQKEGCETQKSTVFDAIPQTQMSQEVSESQLMALCSGTFTGTQIQTQSTVEVSDSVIKESGVLDLSSSDEDGNEKETAAKSKRKTKKVKKLKFSDDEGDSVEEIDDNESNPSLEDGENEEIENEIDHNEEDVEDVDDVDDLENEVETNQEDNVETYIDYDSDENEVIVKMTKTDREKKATEFFENEAELSDSEWGSADEDEKGLDKYDVELGDEDHFDKDKIKSDLEKIHLRRLLDQDTRDIKKIEEMLFKTEELDGIGRERKFRWKNIDDSFDLNAPTTEGTEQNNESDEEDEMQWRKLRYERELLLKSQTQQEDDDPSISLNQTKDDADSSIKKKIKIMQPVKNTPTTLNPFAAKFLISKTVQVSNAKGSFLVRGQDTLSRLSTILKSNSETDDGLQLKTAKGGNFVFSRIDPEADTVQKKVAVKRKSEVSAAAKENSVKKSKLSLLM